MTLRPPRAPESLVTSTHTMELQLRQEDANLVFLAVAYHLGRPGSELDPITKLPVEHGLADVARERAWRRAWWLSYLDVDQVFLRRPRLAALNRGQQGET